MEGSSVKLTLRLPQTLHERLRRRAQESDRSLNAVIVETLRDGLETTRPEARNVRQQALKLLREHGLVEDPDPIWQKYVEDAPQISHAMLREQLKGVLPLSEIIVEERGPQE